MRKHLKAILAISALAGLGGAAWLLWRGRLHASVPRIVILGPRVAGITPNLSLGLGTLIRDELEVKAERPVVTSPSETPPQGLLAEDLLVRFSGTRSGDTLALGMDWISGEELRAGRPWHTLRTQPHPPPAAFSSLWEAGPWPSMRGGVKGLLPDDPKAFWELARQSSVQEDVEADQDLGASERLAQSEPGSAAAWANLGEHVYRDLWTRPASGDLPQIGAVHALDHALALIPGYPRAALLKGMLLTDLGDQRDALKILVEARARRPGVPGIYSGLAYAGRTAGLLAGARRALADRDRLAGPVAINEEWFVENTYLYTGHLDQFLQSLPRREDPIVWFYRGYLSLIQGQPKVALASFQAGAADRSTSIPFSDLCGVYALALQGKHDEALAALQRMDEARGHLRIPDGELTFKIAEAYAYLNQPEEAITVAGRAFAQGFGCLEWYDQSPLFAAARGSLRWKALRQHLQDRQELLARSYPLDTFG